MNSFEIYLPIAEMPVSIIVLLLLGIAAGFLSGMFGIGGGFILAPLLIFIGIPPAVAVASASNQIIASSVAGFITHWRRKNVDIKMGLYLTIGGFIGSSSGVWVFSILRKHGQIDLVISIAYVIFLSVVGILMAKESLHLIKSKKRGLALTPIRRPAWTQYEKLPWLANFPRSELNISILLPVSIGFLAGVLVSLLGIGGGFLMIPAMIYILGMSASVVIGTSLMQIIFTTSNVTFLQAINTHTVDIVLVFLLVIGSVIGVQFGMRAGAKLPPEKMRMLLAALILSVALKLAFNMFIEPKELYSVIELEDKHDK